ncbi:ninja-family protein AFP1-like isoform X2 [Mangifera indica]|uniref:ninja-family protein AFP1-like isoform X2 n=1 Tax=Mangifera indica TaxID=29780 RepID=UPI001CFC091B|nr:ninja-family protein AFP1-like isoform X2 [Mangifera indica]
MGESSENRKKSREMHNLSLQIEKYPRDLLQRFMSASDTQQSQVHTPTSHNEEKAEEIELNLGLSLGGRFGVDKNAKKKLLRSSSIAGSIPIFREFDIPATLTTASTTAATAQSVMYPALTRASSLPSETEEEWRKRKELQSLRRMEAKRRRNEKQRNSSSNPSGNVKVDRAEMNMEEENQVLVANKAAGHPSGMQSWASAARHTLLASGVKGGGGFLQVLVQSSSQGSVESQGGSSSGMSELEGSSSGGEARSPASTRSWQDRSSQEIAGSSGTNTNENSGRSSMTAMENPPKKLESSSSGMKAYEDMPCVFTKGSGPNGRRIDGILYKYGKGEEVRIMCVCHGSFLSPAEFVKHAGGGDVDHPLRHIVINPSPTPFS